MVELYHISTDNPNFLLFVSVIFLNKQEMVRVILYLIILDRISYILFYCQLYCDFLYLASSIFQMPIIFPTQALTMIR
jgi:hypothetical protein